MERLPELQHQYSKEAMRACLQVAGREANVLVCQVSNDVYLYTVKPILPNQELLVSYSRNYGDRVRRTVLDNLFPTSTVRSLDPDSEGCYGTSDTVGIWKRYFSRWIYLS